RAAVAPRCPEVAGAEVAEDVLAGDGPQRAVRHVAADDGAVALAVAVLEDRRREERRAAGRRAGGAGGGREAESPLHHLPAVVLAAVQRRLEVHFLTGVLA